MKIKLLITKEVCVECLIDLEEIDINQDDVFEVAEFINEIKDSPEDFTVHHSVNGWEEIKSVDLSKQTED